MGGIENTLTYIPLIIYLSIATYFDVKYLKIPDKLTATFFILRLIFIRFIGFNIKDNLVGFYFGFFTFLIPAMIANKPMGGDIKSFATLGLYLGFKRAVAGIVCLIVTSLIAMLVKKYVLKDSKDTPLAPFFLLSVIILMIMQVKIGVSF